jgi:hypothetical protein
MGSDTGIDTLVVILTIELGVAGAAHLGSSIPLRGEVSDVKASGA